METVNQEERAAAAFRSIPWTRSFEWRTNPSSNALCIKSSTYDRHGRWWPGSGAGSRPRRQLADERNRHARLLSLPWKSDLYFAVSKHVRNREHRDFGHLPEQGVRRT
jgi:hypothetical protein